MFNHRFVQSNGTIIHDMKSVVNRLEAGEQLVVESATNQPLPTTSVKFPVAKVKNRYGDAGFWVHGTPARSLDQVLDFLDGDAHDVSKVQWFNGEKFFDFISRDI